MALPQSGQITRTLQKFSIDAKSTDDIYVRDLQWTDGSGLVVDHIGHSPAAVGAVQHVTADRHVLVGLSVPGVVIFADLLVTDLALGGG